MTEEKNKLLRVASTSIGLNAVLLMSVTKPVSTLCQCTHVWVRIYEQKLQC